MPANWFLAIGAGVNLKSCTLGANCTAANFVPPATIGPSQVSNDPALIDAPTLLDPADTANLLVATCRVWRGPATSGSAWTSANAISAPLGGSAPCSSTSPLIRSLGAGGPAITAASAQNAGSTVLYAGLAGTLTGGGASFGGHLLLTKSANTATGTTAWADLALSPVTNDTVNAGIFNPVGFDISSITVDAHDPTGATVYATILGFNAAGGAHIPHLYRSTDFGAHWLNVSGNLPDAPANAMLVDSNSANTVYIALDTGVYVASDITTCATSSCWSVFGTSLPNSPAIALAAAPQMATGDGRVGMLRVATYGRGLWQQPLLNAITIAQPGITLSASSFNFAAQQVSTQSSAQTLTLTSTGNEPLTISSIAISTADFTETDNCAGQTLAINATCAVSILFAPTVQGAITDTLTIYANISSGQANASLTGIGTAPASLVLTPGSLSFPATLVNQTAPAQIITVANTGGNTAALQTPTISGDFSLVASTCAASLASQTACSLSLAFTPTASGARSGTLSLTDSAGTQTASLAGTGQAPATDTLSAATLAFPQTFIGTASTAQTITLTNAGDVPLTLLNAAVSGAFTVNSGCGNSLAAKSTCALLVAFLPTTNGAASGTLTVTDQFRSQAVALTGIGIAPPGVSLTPVALNFPATGVGLIAAPQTLTLTNNGGTALNLTNIAINGDFQIAATTCSAPVPISGSCAFTVLFVPTAAGQRTGALLLTDNALSTTQTVSLTGTGVDFTLTPDSLTSMTVPSGTSATYSLLLSALGGVTASASLACSGAPAHSLCTVAPASATLGAAQVIVVTVQTGLSTGRLTPPQLGPRFRNYNDALYALLLFPVFALRKRQRRALAVLSMLALCGMITAFSGCGSGRKIPGDTSLAASTPTPSGTYTLNVSANSTGLTRSVQLTLIVQ